MSYRSALLLSGLTLAAALAGATAVQPVTATPRPARNVTGDYYGNCTSRSNFWALEMNLRSESSKRVSGRMTLGAVYHGIPLAGTLSAWNWVTLTGRKQFGTRTCRFRLQGRYIPSDGSEPPSIIGTYVFTGDGTERGSFTVAGSPTRF